MLMRLLDFSRMAEPDKEYLDVNGIVDDTILFTEHHLMTFRKVRLTIAKEEHLPHVYADKIHVQQALINLLMNAAQAMPRGGPVLVRTGRRDIDYAWISVSGRNSLDPLPSMQLLHRSPISRHNQCLSGRSVQRPGPPCGIAWAAFMRRLIRACCT